VPSRAWWAFLQGCAPELQEGLLHPEGLPEGPRFASMRELFSNDDETALARHRGSLFLDELRTLCARASTTVSSWPAMASRLATTGDFESLRRRCPGVAAWSTAGSTRKPKPLGAATSRAWWESRFPFPARSTARFASPAG